MAYAPSPIELLAGEIASDVSPWVQELTLEKLTAIREAVQRRLDCGQGRKYMRRILTVALNCEQWGAGYGGFCSNKSCLWHSTPPDPGASCGQGQVAENVVTETERK